MPSNVHGQLDFNSHKATSLTDHQQSKTAITTSKTLTAQFIESSHSCFPIQVSNSYSMSPSSRRTSTDSFESNQSSITSNATSRSTYSAFSSALSSPAPSSPSSSSSRNFGIDHQGWSIDQEFELQSQSTEQSDSDELFTFNSVVWKPTRPPPLPMPQHEPIETKLKIKETKRTYEIMICLPSFSSDSITVAQRSQDRSIHIVADQIEGRNTGHFERLIQLNFNTQPNNQADLLELPSREVSSKFEFDHLIVKIVKIGWSREYQRAVVCDNGSGLTGNKTYRLFL